MSSSYQDLVVWQRAMDHVTDIYQLTKRFPKDELYGLTSQLRRAAVSVASNIAEGQGHFSTGEFRHFVGHALGSLLEVETQLMISVRLGYTSDETVRPLLYRSRELTKMLHGLGDSLAKQSPEQGKSRGAV